MNCSEGSIRLAGGPTQYEGRLEICFNSVWGTIHGFQDGVLAWSEIEAAVVCSQLGLNRTGTVIELYV